MDTDQIISEVLALDQRQPRRNRELPLGQQLPDYKEQQNTFDAACEEMCERLRTSGGTAAFEALFMLACYEFQPSFNPQYQPLVLAGKILFYIQPPCTMSCRDAVRAVSLSHWNVSLEEVIWYLAAHFGPDAVYEAYTAVEKEAFIVEIKRQREIWRHERDRRYGTRAWIIIEQPGDASIRLETIRYWMNIYVEDAHNMRKNWRPHWQWHRK